MYTCQDGKGLFEKGRTFGAWYEKTWDDDIAFLINEEHEVGERILSIESIEFIEDTEE
jgi:hypothetical protein